MNQTQNIISHYIQQRRAHIPVFLKDHLDNSECLAIQKTHLLKDLIKNPINVFWSIPFFFIKKTLEISEKLGF